MRTIKTLTLVLVGTLWTCVVGWGGAAVPEADRIRRLEAEVMKLREEQDKSRQRMEALLAELEKMKKAPPTPMPEKPSPVRARFDVLTRFASESQSNFINQFTDEREGIFLTRVRAHLDGQLGPGLDGGLQLTTGGSPNPTSPFIRLTGASTAKSFDLGRAYFNYRPFRSFSGFNLTMGKMANPFWRGDVVGNHNSELIWDDDVNPEGLAISTPIPLKGALGKRLKLNNTLGFFMINNPTEQQFLGLNNNTTLLAGQLVADYKPVKFGFSYYDYQGLNSGLRARAFNVPAAGDPFGATFDVLPSTDAFLLRPGLQTTNNSVTYAAGSHGLVSNRFTNFNLTAQYNFPDWFKGRKLYFLFDGIKNYRVVQDDLGMGITLGGRSADLEKVGSFNAWLTWRDVKADATLATFADSDLGAGTDYRGWELGGSLRIQPKTNLQIGLFHFKHAPRQFHQRTRLFIDVVRFF